MKLKAVILFLTCGLFLALPVSRFHGVHAQGVAIRAPRQGDILRGQITITGNSDVPGFDLMSLHFAYQNQDTWFLIYESQTPIREGPLATWDTTLISDGTYRLRIQVFLADGTVLEDVVTGLVVGNTQAPETKTPALDGIPAESTVTPLPTATRPTSTPLPDNPLILTQDRVASAFKTGLTLALLLVFLLFAYRTIRKMLDK